MDIIICKNFIRNLYENLSQNYQMGGNHMFILVECCDRNMELLGIHDKKQKLLKTWNHTWPRPWI